MSAQPNQGQPMPTPLHKPYPPKTAGLGGTPTVNVDVPISAVFMALFLVGAVTHMAIFQINRRRNHFFIFNALTFGFCMARIVTLSLRIAWAVHPRNASLAIAAQVFVAAGVVLLFVINLVLTQRIVRARHPTIGWHKATSAVFTGLYVLIVLTITILITVVIQSFYTLNTNILRIDRDIQLYGVTCFTIIAFLPMPILAAAYLLPPRAPVDHFGQGSMEAKTLVVLVASVLLLLGAGFRAGIAWTAPRPRTDPAWYHSKACFYVFNFTTEILTVYWYAAMRKDKRFFVPSGAKGPGSYSAKTAELEVIEHKDMESA